MDAAPGLSQSLLGVMRQMAPDVARLPRRQAGRLVVGGRYLRYADLHSFYHQVRQLFGERLYDAELPPAPVILDCGAHIGLASLLFKERWPAARITAFEADAGIAEMATANLAAFGFADVAVHAKAVWTHDRGVTFAASGDDAGHVNDRVNKPGGEPAETKTVPSVRLKDLITAPVDLLKLDIEGAEFAVLADCASVLAHVARMIIEVHALGDDPAPVGALLSQLEQSGFRYVLGDLHAATWQKPFGATPFTACPTDRYIVTVYAWR